MGETTSFAKKKTFKESSPPALTVLEELGRSCTSNQMNQTIPRLKPINNNIPTDIHSVLGTSTSKVVLINKNDTLHQVVVPNNVVLSQDAGPARVNIPEVGPVTIKIDPAVKNRKNVDQSEPLYLEYETPAEEMSKGDPQKQDSTLPIPDQEERLRGFTEEDIKIAEEQYNDLKRIMEEYENQLKQDDKLVLSVVPGTCDMKTTKLDKSLSVLINRNDSIEAMCNSHKE